MSKSELFQLLSRRNALHDRAQSRRAALEDSFHLQQFFRDSDELKSWINEKMKTATDEAYKVQTLIIVNYVTAGLFVFSPRFYIALFA